MNNTSIVITVIVIVIILYIIKNFYDSDYYNLKCIISNVDGQTYCVRERDKLQLAADLLAKVNKKCKDLVIYVGNKHSNDPDMMRLVKKFNPTKIMETLPTSEFTAYSENKGEKVAFCLNTTKEGNKLIDLDTLTFVAIHELAHIMTESEGHKQVFWQNFKKLLVAAKEGNIYEPKDYKKEPKEYCGMTISDNPYFDLA